MDSTTQSQPQELIDLALVDFPELTKPEKKLLEAAQRGDWSILADAGTTREDEGEDSKQARQIRAELVRWLCTNQQASAKVDARGIKVVRALVKGTLDLSYTSVSFALEFEESDFPDGLDLKSAQLARLSLRGSNVKSVWATHLVTLGDVSLNYDFCSEGSVIFDRCRIGGDLDCRKGAFSVSKGTALSMHSGKIEGSVLLSEGFSATGEVQLGSASIGGNFICSGGSIVIIEEEKSEENKTDDSEEVEQGEEHGQEKSLGRSEFFRNVRNRLRSLMGKAEEARDPQTPKVNREEEREHPGVNPSKVALECSQIHIGGSAFLRNGFEISGEARMIGASIVGDLDCRGSRFSNPGKGALVADRIKIGSDAFFDHGFETDGFIVLESATIEGNLLFDGTTFIGETKCGVVLEVATIKRTLVWQNIKKNPEMILNLADANVGRLLDDQKSWPCEGKLSLFGFKYGRISGAETLKLRIHWVQLAIKGMSLQPYEQLASVLKAAGHETEAKQVAIAREDARRKYSGLSSWVKLWKHILKVTVGYGYAPRRALYWAAGMILLGWFLFGTGYQKSLFSPVADGIYRDPTYLNSEQTLPNGYQTFNSLVYSVDSFLPIIDLHQESKWLPNPTQKCIVLGREISGGMLIRVYLWIHIIAGWALTTLAVAGFTGVIRKE